MFNTPSRRMKSWTKRKRARGAAWPINCGNLEQSWSFRLQTERLRTVSEGLLVQLTEQNHSKWSLQTLIWCWWPVLVCTEISSHSCDILRVHHFNALYNWSKAMDKLIYTVNVPEVNTKCANYFSHYFLVLLEKVALKKPQFLKKYQKEH